MIDKSIIQKNNMIRYKILEMLYLANQEGKRLNFGEMVETLEFSEVEINQNMKFLEEEYLVEDIRRLDGNPYSIKITSSGIGLIEKIEILKQNKKRNLIYKNALTWLKINASWIAPSIIEIIKLTAT